MDIVDERQLYRSLKNSFNADIKADIDLAAAKAAFKNYVCRCLGERLEEYEKLEAIRHLRTMMDFDRRPDNQ